MNRPTGAAITGVRRTTAAAVLIALAGAAHRPASPAHATAHARADDPAPALPPTPPSSDRRVVHVFDFEEPGNPDPIPALWVRAQHDPPFRNRPGFPAWNQAAFDRSIGAAADHTPPRPDSPDTAATEPTPEPSSATSVILPVSGGSTSLRLRPGAISVFPGGDYVVTAKVRTRGLKHARAVLAAGFYAEKSTGQHRPDRAHDPGSPRLIDPSHVFSDPVLSESEWTTVRVRIPGDFPEAAFLHIDLLVLQPSHPLRLAHHTPSHRSPSSDNSPLRTGPAPGAIALEDLSGAAWFDDVVVYQVPRVSLTTASPTNISIGGDGPVLIAEVRDLTGEPILASLVVRDLNGNILHAERLDLDAGGGRREIRPPVPGFGWFHARLDVQTHGPWLSALVAPQTPFESDAAPNATPDPDRLVSIESVETSLLWLPEPQAVGVQPPGRDARAAFGIAANDLTPGRLPGWGRIIRQLGTGFVVMPAWWESVRRTDAEPLLEAHRPVLEDLLAQGQVITLTLPSMPEEIASRLQQDPTDAYALVALHNDEWITYIRPVIDRYGQRILRWQIGPVNDDHGPWRNDVIESLAKAESALSGLVPGPITTVAWQATRPAAQLRSPAQSPDPSQPASHNAPQPNRDWDPIPLDAVTLTLPSHVSGLRARSVVKEWSGDPGQTPEVTLVIEHADPQEVGLQAAACDFFRRTVEVWAAVTNRRLGEQPLSFAADAPRTPVQQDDKVMPRVRIAASSPWTWRPQEPSWNPAPTLAVWRNLVLHLAGRRIIGTYPAGDGLVAYIAADASPQPGSPGALLVWNESAAERDALLTLPGMEANLIATDLFGNNIPWQRRPKTDLQPATFTGSTDAAGWAIPVGPLPIIIEGIDPYLARFIASLRIDPELVLSTAAQHEHELVIENPWPVQLTGRLKIVKPTEEDHWQISPRGMVSITIPAGGVERIPVTMSFGQREEAGPKWLEAMVEVTTDRKHPVLRLRAPMEVGLLDLELAPEVVLSPDPTQTAVIVLATVTNRGSRERVLTIDALAPGQPRQKSDIGNLAPGETVVRRFLFDDPDGSLSGHRIRLSLSDLDLPERLNKSILVP